MGLIAKDTSMCYSVRNNWLGIVPELLRMGVDVNIMTEAGTPLIAACLQGSVDAVRLLLLFGASPDLATSETHPLLKACEIRRQDIIELLLEYGADVQARDKQNKSALHYALESSSTDDSNPDVSIVNLLLDRGADTNTSTSSGETPLYIACSKGLIATVQMMLKRGARVNVSAGDKSPLNVACKMKNKALVKLLLDGGADPNIPEETIYKTSFSLHIAAADNNVEFINLLLYHRANVNVVDFSGNTALHHFILSIQPNRMLSQSTVSLSVLHTLLQAGADVNIINRNGESPLYLAVKLSLLDIVDGMLSHVGNSMNDEEISDLCKFAFNCCSLELVSGLLFGPSTQTMQRCYPLALYFSVRNNWLGIVRELLKRGVNVDIMTVAGTPLIVACQQGSVDTVRLLLQYGANPNFATLESLPLLKACETTRYDILNKKLLLDHRTDVQVTDNHKKSVLQYAVESISENDSNTDLSTVNLLLDYGADANTPTPPGETTLNIACSKGLTATDERMLKSGACPNGSACEKSPLNVACKTKNEFLVKLLLNERADPNIPEETLNSTSYSLHIAAADNNTELMNLLLSHGANVNVVDFSRNTALHHFILHIRPNSHKASPNL